MGLRRSLRPTVAGMRAYAAAQARLAQDATRRGYRNFTASSKAVPKKMSQLYLDQPERLAQPER